jgi:hypothetical protein
VAFCSLYIFLSGKPVEDWSSLLQQESDLKENLTVDVIWEQLQRRRNKVSAQLMYQDVENLREFICSL